VNRTKKKTAKELNGIRTCRGKIMVKEERAETAEKALIAAVGSTADEIRIMALANAKI
jgi:hypothetical protein